MPWVVVARSGTRGAKRPATLDRASARGETLGSQVLQQWAIGRARVATRPTALRMLFFGGHRTIALRPCRTGSPRAWLVLYTTYRPGPTALPATHPRPGHKHEKANSPRIRTDLMRDNRRPSCYHPGALVAELGRFHEAHSL